MNISAGKKKRLAEITIQADASIQAAFDKMDSDNVLKETGTCGGPNGIDLGRDPRCLMIVLCDT